MRSQHFKTFAPSIAVSSNLTAHDDALEAQTDTGMRSGTSGKQMTSVSSHQQLS
jgi:hypothetical protein